MKFTPILLSLGVVMGAATGALAKPAYVPSTVNLRAAPGTTSEVVSKIPGGSLIDAGECSEGWCEVTFQEKKGFAKQSALDLSGRVASHRTVRAPAYAQAPKNAAGTKYAEQPEYAEGPEEYVEAPPVYYAPRPYYYDGYYGPYYGRPWGWHRRW